MEVLASVIGSALPFVVVVYAADAFFGPVDR